MEWLPKQGGITTKTIQREVDREAVRERADIVKYVREGGIALSKGREDSLFGICPFHKEKTGSFHVVPSKQMYHCFGCGKSGDVFTWIMETQKLPFPEALEYLAEREGVTLSTYQDGRTKGTRDRIHTMLETAERFFMDNLNGAGRE